MTICSVQETSVGSADIIVTEPLNSLKEKLRLSAERDKRPTGAPSAADLLIEERRQERIRELIEEGW
jgi:hypothetical protein